MEGSHPGRMSPHPFNQLTCRRGKFFYDGNFPGSPLQNDTYSLHSSSLTWKSTGRGEQPQQLWQPSGCSVAGAQQPASPMLLWADLQQCRVREEPHCIVLWYNSLCPSILLTGPACGSQGSPRAWELGARLGKAFACLAHSSSGHECLLFPELWGHSDRPQAGS